MKRVIILIIILGLPHILCGRSLDSLMLRLEQSTANRELYFEKKDELLLMLKNALISSSDPEERYELSKQLVFHNSYYDNNSTLYYVNLCLETAQTLGNPELIIEAKLNLANYLRFSGLTHESLEILASLDPDKLSPNNKREYYKTYMHVCYSYTKLQNTSRYRDEYIENAIRYANSYLNLERNGKADYLEVLGYKYYFEKNYQQALNTVKLLLKNDDISPYVRAECYHILGLIYLDIDKNHRKEALEAFVSSAIISNEQAITKMMPFLYVAVLLIEEKHPLSDRAYDYVNIALENATIFGDKFRRDFIKATYYSIQSLNLEKAYLQKHTFMSAAIVVLLFVLVLAASLIILTRNYIALKSSREKLVEFNSKLRDSNRIKETYIKFFINRNSEHIEKVSKHKKHLLKMLSIGSPAEKVRQEIIAAFDTEEDYNNLLADFDQSILELYPCFLGGINKLLKPGFFYTVDQNSRLKLNTELRILALVRMGIEDNKQIASFLRIAVQSVYNYRSKARGRAIDEEAFDEDLAKICMDAGE